ncbi:MAG: M2 family metallopeptidase [Bryobacterales bacterium]|nr:M2 family metallopeptidase [Bryobacterales bacterium]
MRNLVLMLLMVTTAMQAQTVDEAKAFLDEAEATLLKQANYLSRAQWLQSTYINPDSEMQAALANEQFIEIVKGYARRATRFDGVELPAAMARKMKLLKIGLTLVTPSNKAEASELTQLTARMESAYGSGKYCRDAAQDKGRCLDLQDITLIMANSRDPKELLDVWQGWHKVAKPMKKDYQRFVELGNKGARELGFADMGAMWRSKYDMEPDAFAKEVDRLWEQVRPLYVSLHAYVRTRLREKYGAAAVPEKGPIPAHLLGNMWAQSWDNIYDILEPKGAAKNYDLTSILKQKKIDELEMVRYGERFFQSLGFAPLPKTFYERSLFVKPQDREVVCHASAWDVDNDEDLRIKMCIQITGEEFAVIHHELGHNIYQRAYRTQPFLFRDSANDGFHEAVGDTIALSITPEYLVQVGLLDKATDPSGDIGLLLKQALAKVSFLPFGLMIDQWRWKVYSGEITPANFNQKWWELRRKYQGVDAAGRTEDDFDPAAKYHVAANVPYTRYFLAHILQFQFHRALSQAAGCKTPLHRCSIYNSKEAGKKLNDMLSMGLSQPWPVALRAITGKPEMDATAIKDYFAPLQKWLDEQNKGKAVGW